MAPDPEILSGERVRLDRRRQEPDVVATAARTSGPGFTRRQMVVTMVVVLVVAGGWLVDRVVGEHESSAISACDRQLRAVSQEYDVRMGAMYDYVRPSFTERAPGTAALVSSLMAQPARQVLPAATAAASRCRSVRVLSWHSGSVAHRNADSAYASALVLRLREVAGGRHAFQLSDPPLSRLRAAAGIPAALGA